MDNQQLITETKNYRKEKVSKKRIIGSISAVLALCIAIAAFWFLHSHKYGKWEIIKEATRTENGEIAGKCFCGKKEQRVIYAGSQGLSYEVISKDTCKISGIGTCKDSELVISNFYDGYEVISIREYSFMRCKDFTSLYIPDSVKTIEQGAFAFCTELRSVDIPDSVTSIDLLAFNACDNLKSVNIGDGVKSIGEQAFSACNNLTDLTIGKNVKTIWKGAFENCRNLTSVTYNGTVSEWGKIDKGNYWNNYTVYCTDGTVFANGQVVYN